MGKQKQKASFPAPGATETQIDEAIRRIFGGLETDLGALRTPEEELAAVEDIFGPQERRAEENLHRFGVELAGARGLNLTDSPIGRPLLEQRRILGEQFGSARAQFLQALRQQAIQNRLSLFGAGTEAAVGLGGIRTRTPTQVTQSGFGLSDVGSLAGGVGGLLLGAGSLFGGGAAAGSAAGVGATFGLASSREFKEDIRPLSSRDERAALEAIRETPVNTFRFRRDAPVLGLNGANQKHIGAVAEEAPVEMVSMDGKAINVGDAIGMLMAANKALAAKVEKLERRA